MPVLLDFGAARHAIGVHSKTLTGVLTPGFAPFEQYATRGNQGPWTDIYALGATLYRAITGAKPPEAVDRIEQDNYVPASMAAPPGFSPGFLHAIDEALEMSAGKRPQTVAEWRTMFLEDPAASTSRPPASPLPAAADARPEDTIAVAAAPPDAAPTQAAKRAPDDAPTQTARGRRSTASATPPADDRSTAPPAAPVAEPTSPPPAKPSGGRSSGRAALMIGIVAVVVAVLLATSMLFRLRQADIMPVAREKIIERMGDGVVVSGI